MNIPSPGGNFFKIFLHGNNFWGAYVLEGGTCMSIERRKGCKIKLLICVSCLHTDYNILYVHR